MSTILASLRTRLVAGTAATAALAACAIGAPAASASIADLQVYPPYVAPLGKTYSQHGADWWKFVVTKPSPVNPLTDTTGADCAVGQSGPIWVLAGSFSGVGPITRTCTVPFGKSILIPVSNGIAAAFPGDDPAESTVSYLRSLVTPSQRAVTNLKASIDGSQVSNVSRYFEESVPFSTTLPVDNIFGTEEATVLNPAVDAGYYLMLYPLLPGKHTLKVSASFPDGSGVDVTYKLTVPLFG